MPYRRAAVAYAVYGAIYFGGACASLGEDRRGTYFGFVPWWVFFVAGALILLILPVLIWKRWMWLTRILCLGPAAKALVLCWRMAQPIEAGSPPLVFNLVFAGAAMVATVALFQAGWGPQLAKEHDSHHH
jgi:hypothetical protein